MIEADRAEIAPTGSPTARHAGASALAPDAPEQDRAGPGPDSIASEKYEDQPIVGLGGSAGSLAPLQEFFSQMPPDSGLAFVVVVHLSPNHESAMAHILQQRTRMVVTQVQDREPVEPNRVYVIPPGKHLTIVDGHLTLTELEHERGRRVAVDLFFRTLADTHGPSAVAIVFSGADSDGAIGIKRIKERGGLTIAQDPKESEQTGMPRAAIEGGMIDWVLRAGEMAGRILEYRRAGGRLKLSPGADEGGGEPASRGGDLPPGLREVLAYLQVRTGRDFGGYKLGTVLRRIRRRMQIAGIEDLAAYHAFLRANAGEAGALLQDLLISVTNFFRDREAFAALENLIPALFKGKRREDKVRVWVAGCATGEEAYSIAILLAEHAAGLDEPPGIQVFATDIDEAAVAAARAARYPLAIAADVSEDRLRRFFTATATHYHLNQSLRELVLFAMHDVLRDAPFSHLELVTCRNLLIYLNRESQRRCFDLFHFALRPGGHLFLGTSETTDEAEELFAPVDTKYRLYSRRQVARPSLPIPLGPPTIALVRPIPAAAGAMLPPVEPATLAGPPGQREERGGARPGELHFKLIEFYSPPSVLVDHESRIVHVSPSAGRFLRISGGEPSSNLLELVHPMLRPELRSSLFRAAESNESVHARDLPVELEPGRASLVDLSVRPAPSGEALLFLVVFNEHGSAAMPAESLPAASPTDGLVIGLEREVDHLRRELRNSVEQHGATAEEMKAANEELQAINEELRSAAEELETSREELQSMNEELETVNVELKSRVDELGRANSDMQNLMAATNIATVFVDGELRIKRYTPSAVAVFHLIPGDIGRPLADLRHRLESDTIVADTASVLASFTPAEREVRVAKGRWFLVRLMPYRTADDHQSGVVITFVDITERKRTEDALRESEASLRQAKVELEFRVNARTAELIVLNQALKEEVVARSRAHEMREEMLRALTSAQEAERGRISRELHDEVGQHLTALLLSLGLLEKDLGAQPDARAALQSLRATAEHIGEKIHEVALELRPTALDDLGLVCALSNALEDWASRVSTAIQFDHAGYGTQRLPLPVEITLYRVTCEALHNAVKHAQATSISVVLQRTADSATVIVEDDGIGFDPSALESLGGRAQLGIVGMRERLAFLNGDLTIESGGGRGTTIIARIPLNPDDHGKKKS